MRTQQVFSAEPLLIGLSTINNCVVFANEQAVKYLNIPLSDLVGKSYFNLQNNIDSNKFLPKKFHFIEQENKNNNTHINCVSEQTSDIAWTILSIKSNHLYLLVGIDTAYTLAISNKNVQLQTYLDNILSQIPGYLYWKDKNSTYLGCNANFAKVAGLNSPHQIIGKTDYDLAWRETEAEIFRAGDKEALAGIAKLNFEEPQLMADRKYATVLASKIPLRDKENNIIGVLGIYNDITERKKAEQDLAIAKVKAEAANKVKTEFIENMSHDLKTPLNGILGLSTILLSRERDQAKKELIEGIKQSGEKLLFLLNEILELSRLEEGYIPVQKKEFNLRALMEDIRILMLIQAQEKDIQLSIYYPNNIPDNVIADPHRVHRIILNLVNNALKFTHEGKIEIEIAADDSCSEIIISVQDTGIGIPEDKLNIIFDRFTRLEASYKGRYQGSGLGLGIVKQFLADIGGKILVKSKLGKGSVFTCIIPIEVSNELNAIKNSHAIAKENGKKKIRVLVIENEKLSQIIIGSLLSELNCSFTLTVSAEQALQNLDKEYDIIITDIGLPDKSGINLAKIIRRECNMSVPIIAVTAHLSESLKNNCLDAGMQEAYAKPITKEVLQNVLSKYVSKLTS